MKKIRVLFTISNIEIGGPQKSLLALLDKIDYKIFDVYIYILEPGGDLAKYFNSNVHFLETSPLITAATLPSSHPLKYLMVLLEEKEIIMFLGFLKAIFRHLILRKNMNQERQLFWKKNKKRLPQLEEGYDLTFGILGLSTYFIIDCVKAAKKFHWIRSDIRILKRNQEIDAFYFKKLTGSLAVSQQTANIFTEVYPFMKEQTKVLYNYIPLSFYSTLNYDESLLQQDSEYKKILTVCRLDPLKGIEMAIDACEYLINKRIKIKWYVLGDGKHRDAVEKMIIKKGLQDNFILLGFQLNTLSFIKDCDIFVHPSRTEGKSNAVDEAKYVGKPIVVTNYDTVREQIEDNVNGIICEMSGIEIADSIMKILSDDELGKKISRNCINGEDGIKDLSSFFLKL